MLLVALAVVVVQPAHAPFAHAINFILLTDSFE